MLFFWTPKIGVTHLFLHLFPRLFLSVADFPGFFSVICFLQMCSSSLVFPLLWCVSSYRFFGVIKSSLPTCSLIWILPVNSAATVCNCVCLVTPVKCPIVQEVVYGRKDRLHLWSKLDSIPFDILQTKIIRDLLAFPYKLMLIEAKQ